MGDSKVFKLTEKGKKIIKILDDYYDKKISNKILLEKIDAVVSESNIRAN